MNENISLMNQLTELVPKEPDKPTHDLDIFVVSCTKTAFVPSCCADTALQEAIEIDSWDTLDYHVELMTDDSPEDQTG